MEITAQECSLQGNTNFMLGINDLIADICHAVDAQVTWLKNFTVSNRNLMKLKYNWYNNFLKGLDSFGRVREMMKQQYSAQQRKTEAMNKPSDLLQHSPKLQ